METIILAVCQCRFSADRSINIGYTVTVHEVIGMYIKGELRWGHLHRRAGAEKDSG
jgi:hypothetical protein